jgi:hypothetical protein
MRLLFVLLALTTTLVVSACGSLTQIDGSWSNPEYRQNPMKKIAVFTVGARNFISKATIEAAVVKEMQENGLGATASTDMFNPSDYDKNGDGQIDDPGMKDRAAAKLAELGFDGVMIIVIKDVKQEERYVPGTVSYQPTSSYYNNGWYGYWSQSYQTVETPGYMATDVTAFVEASLYNLAKNGLAWTAQSETFNPTSIQDASNSFAAAIVPEMSKSGVIATTK